MGATLRTRIALVVLLGLVASHPVLGQTESERARALAIIWEFTAKACPRPSLDGRRTTVGGKADLSAELKGLTRALMDVKGTIGGQAEKVTWDGLAQADIARALESTDKCTIELNRLLIPRFIPEFRASAPERPASAPGDKPPIAAQYAARSQNGIMVWRFGLHPTAAACLASLARRELTPMSGESTRTSECFRLPDRPACSYESFEGGPAYPVCYWTLARCEEDYGRITIAAAGREDARRVKRSGCEEVERTQAAAHYELWSNPRAHRVGQLPPVWAHRLTR